MKLIFAEHQKFEFGGTLTPSALSERQTFASAQYPAPALMGVHMVLGDKKRQMSGPDLGYILPPFDG